MKARVADPAKLRRHLTTTRKGEDSATYRVLYGGYTTEWKISRNDNELQPGGCRYIAWTLTHDRAGTLHENERKGDCLNELAKRMANRKPIFADDLNLA